ncbi:LPS-assembly protein LptD [Humitalea sp. 24SJ18S-53]|uniref:LPS-assembly protein LptD n=1 Tax=Humitalea sp. 24SJ18S-53 TaxID=3422307 RepID=UPI003D666DAE
MPPNPHIARGRAAWPRPLAGASLLALLLAPGGHALAQSGLPPGMEGLVPGRFDSSADPGRGRGAGVPGTDAGRPASAPPGAGQLDRNAPVTFTADTVEYDQENNIVSAAGSVEAWQGERILRADRFTYNRNTGVATAEGNIQLLEADGQVLFADRVELQAGMRDGVVEGMRAYMLQNGRMVANGARRSGNGQILDMARIIYSPCDLCVDNPEAPPAWQVRARTATRDLNDMRIRFTDATLQVAGWPIAYTPYLSVPDPSIPRQSGFLSPSVGTSKFLGPFIETPYYWAIDGASDLTISPLISADQDPNLGLEYRRRFNNGYIEGSGSLGYFNGNDSDGETGFAGHIFSRGRFALNETWRYGFDLNRATSDEYLQTFRYGSRRVLPTTAFTEGFWGTEAYARVDARAYQGLRTTDDIAQIPSVLPNVYYEQVLAADSMGGRLSYDLGGYAVMRDVGTSSRRLASRVSYDLPRQGIFGDQIMFRVRGDGLGHWAEKLDEPPNNVVGLNNASEATGNVRAAIDWRLPMVRSAGEYGRQVIEPRVQMVTGPQTGSQINIANEDSLNFEFTDSNLFALNRFIGRDRQEGGSRVDAALRGAWYFPNGGMLEALGGRSFSAQNNPAFPEYSGLAGRSSDWVGRIRAQPVPWLDLVARTRLDKDTLEGVYSELTASVGLGPAAVYGGYLFTPPNQYITPVQTRREVQAGVSGRVNENWRSSVFGRYDVQLNEPVSIGAALTYEDECLILDARYVRSYAVTNSTGAAQPGDQVLLFRIGLKTVGDYYLRAL